MTEQQSTCPDCYEIGVIRNSDSPRLVSLCDNHKTGVLTVGDKLPNDTFEDYLPLTPVRFAPGEYKIMSRDGRQLWIMEGASLADFICQSVNGYSAMMRERSQKPGRPCERCGGSGFQSGYGGNHHECVFCLGTGIDKTHLIEPLTSPDRAELETPGFRERARDERK